MVLNPEKLMVDFRKIAGQARAEYEGRQAKEAEERKQRTDARMRQVDAGVAALTSFVMPLLAKAVGELQAGRRRVERQRGRGWGTI